MSKLLIISKAVRFHISEFTGSVYLRLRGSEFLVVSGCVLCVWICLYFWYRQFRCYTSARVHIFLVWLVRRFLKWLIMRFQLYADRMPLWDDVSEPKLNSGQSLYDFCRFFKQVLFWENPSSLRPTMEFRTIPDCSSTFGAPLSRTLRGEADLGDRERTRRRSGSLSL